MGLKQPENMKVIHDENREKSLQEICKRILSSRSEEKTFGNGTYLSICPFCRCCTSKSEGSGTSEDEYEFVPINKLNHKPDCIYLIAKDLTTEQ